MATRDHPHAQTILRYYQGCNTGDVDLMKSTFTDDVVHYFVDLEAVSGADTLAALWQRAASKTKASWHLDHIIVEGDEAVIEWTMRWTPKGLTVEEILRGTEWYLFEDGLIKEIRSYHNNFHLADPSNFELKGFDYAQRTYTLA
ncbi:MAG: nuclear transport factor 2 family protein [Pseudomonadota bacterium]